MPYDEGVDKETFKMKITVSYSSIDRCYKTRYFATLAGARKFAHRCVGAHPEMGGYYAVSGDGIGKITVSGDASLKDLFPEPAEDDGPALGSDESKYDDRGWPKSNSYL